MLEHPGYELVQINDRSIVRLRVRPGGADAAGKALQLPQALLWRDGDPMTCWISPDQWLFISDSNPVENIISQIHEGLPGQLHAATDMSSHHACFKLTGPAARTVLAMGCGIDMHPDAFTAGQCVRTHFANVALLIVALEVDHFDLYLDRSYARYLGDWFANAGEDPITRDPKHHS
jgi:sarcosine oxidase subunit gamma